MTDEQPKPPPGRCCTWRTVPLLLSGLALPVLPFVIPGPWGTIYLLIGLAIVYELFSEIGRPHLDAHDGGGDGRTRAQRAYAVMEMMVELRDVIVALATGKLGR
jgi:hypothetical protein